MKRAGGTFVQMAPASALTATGFEDDSKLATEPGTKAKAASDIPTRPDKKGPA
jgi:hypothetical protein